MYAVVEVYKQKYNMKYMDKREDYCYVFLRKKGLETNYAAENSNWSLHEFRDKPPTTGLLLFLNAQARTADQREDPTCRASACRWLGCYGVCMQQDQRSMQRL
jgi:hypothetical protein